MDEALSKQWMMAQQDQQISEAIAREKPRLRNFIRKRVDDQSDAEDILPEVFYEFVEAYRMMKPVEQVTAWLFRVARNRITDLFRSKKREASSEPAGKIEDVVSTVMELSEMLVTVPITCFSFPCANAIAESANTRAKTATFRLIVSPP